MLYYFNSQQISNIAENSYRTEGSGANTPTAKTSEFSYDANGNLIYTATGTVKDTKLQATNTRKLLWDEENRLLGVSDNGFVSQYWYDAAGERTVKESFDNEGVYVNGALSGARTGTSKFTAYVSPYMVVSQGGNYTKHVYMGSQRITSKVSNSGIFKPENNPVNTTEQQAKLTQQTTLIKERFDSLGVKYSGVQQTGGLVSASPANTADSYFYHPDHLGSSSLITNKDGYLVQHIQYVPFGEVFVEERNANWSTPYKFNGKEQDEETGLCYYGARYYDPRTSVWLSVDPLAEKFAGWSSYIYCHNNPINAIDPDGRADTFNSSGRFMGSDGVDDGQIFVQIGASPVALSKLDYSKQGTAHAVSNIIGHYAQEQGNSGIYGVAGLEDPNAGAATEPNKSVFFNATQLAKGTYDNKYDLINSIEHEGFHKKENFSNGYTYMAHANVYYKQAHTNNFKKSSDANKASVAVGFATRVIRSYLAGEIVGGNKISENDVRSIIDNFTQTTGIGINYTLNESTYKVNFATVNGENHNVKEVENITLDVSPQQ